MNSITLSLGIVFGFLFAGYIYQQSVADQSPGGRERLRHIARKLQRFHILVSGPIILVLAFWIFDPEGISVISMPLLGAVGLLLGGGLALWAARRMGMTGPQTGSLFVCGMFSNLGSIGALVCFLFFGEPGFVLASLYRLLEQIVYYGFGYPFSNLIGRQRPFRLREFFRESSHNPLTYIPFASILAGIGLQLLGIERPAVFTSVNQFLIPASTAILMLSIGLMLQVRNVFRHLRPCAVVASIKFVGVPVIIGTLAYFLGYHAISGGLPLKVTLIQASAPVAFSAMVPTLLFGLDEEVAQACLASSMAGMAVVVPMLYAVLG